MINKDKIQELVGLFYQARSKTFYINSSDGKTFSGPVGIFVSLGITTSEKTLRDIKEVFEQSSLWTAELVELRSSKVAGQFMNSITKKESNGDEILPYEVRELPELHWEEEEARERVKQLEQSVECYDTSFEGCEINLFKKLIEKIDTSYQGGWSNHCIYQTPEGDYKIFFKRVNYRRDEDLGIDYRIGIYVREK